MPTPECTMKSNPHTEEIPQFTVEGVERDIRKVKKYRAYGIDGTTSNINLGWQSVFTNITSTITYQRQRRYLKVGMKQPLRIGFIHHWLSKSLWRHRTLCQLWSFGKIWMNETYVKIWQNINSQATSRLHLDKLVSDKFPMNRGVRKGDPVSPKLFTA